MQFFRKLFNNKGISLAAAWSFNQLAYAIVYPFIPIYLYQERGLPYTLVSLIFPLLGVAVILAPVPCGWLTDRYGHDKMMYAGQLLRGVIFFVLAFFVYIKAPFWVFAAALMFNTAVGCAFQVGSDAYLVSIAAPEERPSYYGKIRIGYNLGWAIGPMLGAFFAQTPFWVFFILTGILCVIGTFYTQATCCRKQDDPAKNTSIKKEKSPVATEEPVWKTIFGKPRFILLMLGTLLLMMLASQLYSTMSVFSTQSVGISNKQLGSIYSLNGFMVLVLQLPVTALLTRMRVPLTIQLLLGTLLYTLGYFQLGFAAGAWFIAAAVIIVTLGEIVIQPALYTAVSTEANCGNAGRLLSVNSLMRGIGYSVGPWIGAQLFDKVPPLLLWGILSAFAVASGIAFAASGCKSKRFSDGRKLHCGE